MATTNLAEKTDVRGVRTTAEIAAWIVDTLETTLELEPGELDVDEPFDRYGLDSSEAVSLMSALEDWLGCELPPNLPYEYPTVALLAGYLGGERPDGVRGVR